MSSLSSRQFPMGFPEQVGVTGTTNAGPLLAAVPTSPTSIVSKDTYLFQISLTNGTASAISFTLSDKQSSPKAAMDATSIPANTTVSFNWADGIFMKGGMTWGAGGAGLTGSVVAFNRTV